MPDQLSPSQRFIGEVVLPPSRVAPTRTPVTLPPCPLQPPARCVRRERDGCDCPRGCAMKEQDFIGSQRTDVCLTHFFPSCHPGMSRPTHICQASRSLCQSGEREEAAAQPRGQPVSPPHRSSSP